MGSTGAPAEGILYYSMRHRTQLYLEEDQYRWLRQRAGKRGSIAGVVRQLIDSARSPGTEPERDPFLSFLLREPPSAGERPSTVADLDRDIYG